MPLPGKRPPYGFVCPHRNYCPHLEGLSTRWVWEEYQRSGDRENEDGKLIRELEEQLKIVEQQLYESEKKNDELRAKLTVLHKSRFKRRKTTSRTDSNTKGETQQSSESTDEKPKRRRGAPKGHPPWTRSKPDRIDKTILVPAPSVCPDCGSPELTPVDETSEHIQEDIVLQPRTVVTRFLHHQAVCSKCRNVVLQAADGELLNCPIGPHAKAASVFLRNSVAMSYRKVQNVMQVLFGIHFVPASAMAFDRKAAQVAEPVVDVLLEKLQSSDLAFGDETHWREGGKSAYGWYGGNEQVAIFHIVPSRAGEVAIELFGENYQGVLHTDGYAGYNAVHAKHRQTCLGHLITRAKELSKELELIPLHSRDSRSVRFCWRIKTFFQLTCSIANRFRTGQIAREKAAVFQTRLVSTLKSICHVPCSFHDAETLRTRLLDPKREFHRLFTFLHHEGVHPTNNHSEQSVRWLVIFRKICFGTRSKAGSRCLSVLASVIVTGKRNGVHPLEVTLALFTRSNEQILTILFDHKNAPPSLLDIKPP